MSNPFRYFNSSPEVIRVAVMMTMAQTRGSPRLWASKALTRASPSIPSVLTRRRRREVAMERFAQDPVPNRHAAVHGLVSYSSMQNSLNTIFMADYIFQVISFLKNPSP